MANNNRERNLKDWERLQQIISTTGLTTHRFALYIGLARGENLYQIKRGNYGISRELAIRIHQFFPQFNIGWILTGYQDPVIRRGVIHYIITDESGESRIATLHNTMGDCHDRVHRGESLV